MEAAIQVREVSKFFKVLKTVEAEASSRLGRLSSFLLGETFSPQSVRRKVAEIKALDKVSFEVKYGEIFGLYGKNGAGKTTLIHILGIFQYNTIYETTFNQYRRRI